MQVSFGESHKVVGGHPSLGDWDVSNAPQMQWNDGNIWTLEVQLPEGSDIEFKVTSKTHVFGRTFVYNEDTATILPLCLLALDCLVHTLIGLCNSACKPVSPDCSV